MPGPTQSNRTTSQSRISLSRLLGGSATSGLDASRQYYPGAKICTTFTTKGSNSGHTPALTIQYNVTYTREFDKKLGPKGIEHFNDFIASMVEKTKKEMWKNWEFDKKRFCKREMKEQAKTYQSRLASNLEGSGIEQTTVYRVHPEEDHLCQCRCPIVTGASLRFERFAVFTRCNIAGQPIESKYHSMTPFSIPADLPDSISLIRPPLPPLTDIEIDARKEFLNKFHNTFQELVAEDSRRNPGRTIDNATKRNQAILDTMTRGSEFSNMAHIVQHTDANDVLAVPWTVYVDHNRSYWPVEEWTV